MTWQEALDTVVARTGHERFRWLCSDDNPDAVQREGYRGVVLGLAGQPASETPPVLPPLAVSINAVRLGFRQCFYSSHEGCGCAGTHCYRFGRIVQLRECVECLKGK